MEEGAASNTRYPPGDYQGPFPVLVAMRYGKGKVIFSADTLYLINYYIKDEDNAHLALNIIDWLAYGDVPKAMFTANTRVTEDRDEMIAPVGAEIVFDASSSHAKYGTIQQYAWDWDDDGIVDNSTTTPLIRHAFAAPGEHAIRLTVTAEDGTTASAAQFILIVEQSTANFTFYPTHPLVNQKVTFNATHAISQDDPFVRCDWDFDGDGNVDASGAIASWIFTHEGTVTVKLSVTDVSDQAISHEETITIAPDHLPNGVTKKRFTSTDTPLPDGAAMRFGVGIIRDAKFSPNGKYVAIATSVAVELYNPETLEVMKLLATNGQDTRSVSFSPDSTTLAIAYNNGDIELRDTSTAKVVSILQWHSAAVAFFPNGKELVVASTDGDIAIKDIASGNTLFAMPTDGSCNQLAISSDGKLIAAISETKHLMLWKWTGKNATLLFTDDSYEYVGLAFSHDGQSIALGCSDGAIRILHVKDHSIECTMSGHLSSVVSVSFAPNDNHLISASRDGTVRIWDTRTEHTTTILSGFSSPVRALTVSPDGHSLAFGTANAGVYTLNISPGSTAIRILPHYTESTAVSFSRDGRYLAVGSDNGAISMWDTVRYQPTRTAVVHEGTVLSVAFSPDNKLVASSAIDRSVMTWAALGDGSVNTISYDPMGWHISTICCSLAFSPDGRYFAEENLASVITIHDARTMKFVRDLIAGEFWPLATEVSFSPDSQYIATATPENTIRIWKVETGELTKTLTGNEDEINCVTFSPNGRFVAAGSRDKTVRLWDVATGELIHTFLGHTNSVNTVSFSADDRYIVSGSEDGTIILWDVAPLLANT